VSYDDAGLSGRTMIRARIYDFVEIVGEVVVVSALSFVLLFTVKDAHAFTVVDQQTYTTYLSLDNPNLRWAQSFTGEAGNETLATVTTLVGRDGDPTTDYRVAILHGTNPGTAEVLGFVDTQATAIPQTVDYQPTDFAQIQADFTSQGITIVEGEPYFIEFRRADLSSSGATYFVAVALDTDPTATGTLWRRNTGTWAVSSGNNDDAWLVLDTQPAAAQLPATVSSVAQSIAETTKDNVFGSAVHVVPIVALVISLFLLIGWVRRRVDHAMAHSIMDKYTRK